MNERDEANFELETTVPTDLTVSSFSDDGKIRKYVGDPLNDRKKTLREMQLLKLEMNRKTALVNNLQRELTEKTSSFDEKLKDALHQKQVIETRLRSQLTFSEEEFNYKFNGVKKELNTLQEAKKALDDEIQNLKYNLDLPTFSEEDFRRLKSQPKDALSLTNYILLKMYEHVSNFKKENDFLQSRVTKVERLFPNLQDNLQVCREDLQREKMDNIYLKEKYSKLLTEHNDIASRIQHGNYAQENFNRVKCERDRLNVEVLDIKKKFDSLKIDLLEVIQDKDLAKHEVTKLKQNLALLQKECETVSRQLSDVTQRWGESQDKALQLQSELDQAKASQTELMERFMRSRDQQRAEFEDRLKFEKHKINNEAKTLYNNEIRSLTEAKNSLLRQKETTEAAFRDLKQKYEKLFSEYQEKCERELELVKRLQHESSTKDSKLHKIDTSFSQLRIKYQEKCKDYDAISIKLQHTVEELDALKKSSYEKFMELEMELGSSKARLEVFEKLEKEINEVINEAAEITDSNIDTRIDEISHQLPIPASARFSFVRSVHLTRKTMELEKKLESLQRELNNEIEKNMNLSRELHSCHSLLKQADQPYSYLISTVRENEQSIHELNAKVKWLQDQLELTLKEKAELQTERNQLFKDLELILQNREEMSKIKQQIEFLKVTDVPTCNNASTKPNENKNQTQPKRFVASKKAKG